MQSIRIIVVDDIKNTRESIRRILSLDPNFEIVGEAGCGSEAIRLTELLHPDVVLMDISMPEIDGLKAAELLSFRTPNTSIIMMSVENNSEHMTKAMLAGAKGYIVKPFTSSELTSTILNIHHKETRIREIMGSPSTSLSAPVSEEKSEARVISVFSAKGGVGKTTVAINLAVELARSKSAKVLLLDLNLQFGDIASFLNVVPKRTVTDLAQNSPIKDEDIRFNILSHSSGVEILAASSRPEYAEIVTPEHIEMILSGVKPHYDFVICDNSSRLDDISLSALDMAKEIWIVAGVDIPAIKNTKLCLEVLHNLSYSSKVKLILNKYEKRMGISIRDIESSLGMKVNYVIPDEEQLTVILNKGIPFIDALPRSGPALEIKKMATELIIDTHINTEKKETKNSGFQKIFGFGG